jgi:hypothetical protein
MHVLIGDELDWEGGHTDPFIIKECLDPVGAGDLEGRVKADGNIAMPLRLVEKLQRRFGLRENIFAVRRQEPDPDREFSLSTRPFVHNDKAVMERRERVRIDAFKKPHEAQLAAHLLTHIIAQDRIAQSWFDLPVRHDVTLTHSLEPRQCVFS